MTQAELVELVVQSKSANPEIAQRAKAQLRTYVEAGRKRYQGPNIERRLAQLRIKHPGVVIESWPGKVAKTQLK